MAFLSAALRLMRTLLNLFCGEGTPCLEHWSLQVARQLQKVKAEIAASEAAGIGHASALSDKEQQKKWMKF